MAWYDIHGIDMTETSIAEQKLNNAVEKLTKFLGHIAEFANALVIAYCERYDLIEPNFEPPEWHTMDA